MFQKFFYIFAALNFKTLQIMKFIPPFYSSEEQSKDLVLFTRADKFGNVYHYVEFKNNDDSFSYARFGHLSSALDFINSNFK